MTRYPPISRFFLCVLTLLIGHHGLTQDTMVTKPQAIDIKPTTDFDQRFYYVPGERQNVWGYRAGVLINDKYKLGVGGYYMNQQEATGPAVAAAGRTGSPAMINKRLYLGTIYYEPYLLRRWLWETSLVFETGYGRTTTTPDKTGILTRQNTLFIPAGAGLSVNLKLPPLFHLQCFRWVGINAMAGYRATVYRQNKQYSYNGAYWSLSGAVFLDRLCEDYRSWKKQHAAARDARVIQLSY